MSTAQPPAIVGHRYGIGNMVRLSRDLSIRNAVPGPYEILALLPEREGALRRLLPSIRLDEDGFLRAFDTNRDLICATAAKVYARGRKGSYDLVPSDF